MGVLSAYRCQDVETSWSIDGRKHTTTKQQHPDPTFDLGVRGKTNTQSIRKTFPTHLVPSCRNRTVVPSRIKTTS